MYATGACILGPLPVFSSLANNQSTQQPPRPASAAAAVLIGVDVLPFFHQCGT